MATATGKTRCVVCDKEKATLRCGGCLQEYCYKHWESHRQELNKQLDEIEVNRDLFRQSLTEQIEQPDKHTLIQQINQWEQKSIKLIQQTAEEAREVLLESINEYIHRVEINLNKLTDQLRQSRGEDDFNEINLRQFQAELNRLTNELTKPSNISIQEDSTSLINKISVRTSTTTLKSNIRLNTIWIKNGVTVAGGNEYGKQLNQIASPIGICVDDDQTIYVADYGNNRIVEWKYGAINGQVVAGGNGNGNGMNQLNGPSDVIVDKETDNLIICDYSNRRIMQWPRRNGKSGEIVISNIDCNTLTMDNNGYLYISDKEKHEVRRWKIGDTRGTLVAGGNGQGNGLNQLDGPTFIFVDEDHSVYVSDRNNHRVMKWMEGAKEGIVVAGGQGKGNGLTQLGYPEGVVVDHLASVYVADYGNNRIMRFCKGSTLGNIIVGGNEKVVQANQLKSPCSLSFDREGNLYVADFGMNRIQRFNIDRN